MVEAESDEGAAGSARPRANAGDVEVEEKKAERWSLGIDCSREIQRELQLGDSLAHEFRFRQRRERAL